VGGVLARPAGQLGGDGELLGADFLAGPDQLIEVSPCSRTFWPNRHIEWRVGFFLRQGRSHQGADGGGGNVAIWWGNEAGDAGSVYGIKHRLSGGGKRAGGGHRGLR